MFLNLRLTRANIRKKVYFHILNLYIGPGSKLQEDLLVLVSKWATQYAWLLWKLSYEFYKGQIPGD